MERVTGILGRLALAGAVLVAAAAAAPPRPSDLESFVASLEGGWYGEQNATPMGPMPFVMLFERQADGSLHSRSSLNRETYVDLRFARDETGRWMLREEAAMEGLGVQAHTLAPAGAVGDGYRWVSDSDPRYLSVDIGLEGETMRFDVRLRGEEHVSFRLDRLPAEELAELRRQLELQAGQSPEEGISINDVVERPSASKSPAAGADPIGAARRAAGERPDDAAAHLAVAQALGAAIQDHPGNGPLYASEMLSSLQTAIRLDPHLAEAYHWLVGYYLNAPPIAGGSLAKAEETARRLAEFDPEGGEELLRQIDSRRVQR